MRTEYNNYASQALEKAAQDAASCHQKYIGTEHLILGLLAQPDSLSGRVLYENGLNYENFLEAVLGESAALGDNANQTFLGYSPKAEHVRTGFGNRGLGSEDCGTVNKRGAVLHG